VQNPAGIGTGQYNGCSIALRADDVHQVRNLRINRSALMSLIWFTLLLQLHSGTFQYHYVGAYEVVKWLGANTSLWHSRVVVTFGWELCMFYSFVEGTLVFLPMRHLRCEQVLFFGGVCAFVCLSVCLSTQNLENYWSECSTLSVTENWFLLFLCVILAIALTLCFSASEVTTLRRYTNLFIIIIIML